MNVGSVTATISRRAKLAGYVAATLALGAVIAAGTTAVHATETLKLKKVVSIPNGGKITSFDISFVDPVMNFYVLGDRTNKGITVVDTNTNNFVMIAGQGAFTGVVLVNGVANNNKSGPDGVMIVRHREIWAGDGDSTLKFINLGTGVVNGQISTGPPSANRVDEMCFDPIHNIGFVANNAANPPFITAVSARTHSIIGRVAFDGTNADGKNAPNASNGIEQCQFNPRDGMIYVTVPEICPFAATDPNALSCPGDNSAPGGVARIDPLTSRVTALATIPISSCSGPQGLAIGPALGGHGQMLLGCNGAVANAAANRPTAVIDDGTQPGGTFGAIVFTLPFQAGNDMVDYNPTDNHYYLARSGNNSFVNPNPDPLTGIKLGCPNVTGAINYGANIYVSQNTQGEAFPGSPSLTGPAALGMVNASTGIPNADTITGLATCAPTNPGPGGVGKANAANAHGTSHSVAADPAHNQIYVPVASTAVAPGMTGLCAQGGGVDANGCIAVFSTVGSDP